MQFYPLDVAVSFWAKMKQLAVDRKILSIEQVKAEIFHYQGDMKAWVQTNIPQHFFESADSSIDHYAQIVQWAQSRNSHYLPQAITDFMEARKADAWLIAHALKKNFTLVTYETSEPNRKSAIKIPDVCHAVGIPCINVINMFRQLGESW